MLKKIISRILILLGLKSPEQKPASTVTIQGGGGPGSTDD